MLLDDRGWTAAPAAQRALLLASKLRLGLRRALAGAQALIGGSVFSMFFPQI